MSDDQKISQRYRGLPPEEPPRHVDDAILSAARRAVQARPAPLVVPSGRSRWYFPLAAAAVIVLAVAVTVHVQREQPDAEVVSAPVAVVPAPEQRMMRGPAEAEKPKAAPQLAPARRAAPSQGFTPEPKPQPLPEPPVASRPQEMPDQQTAASARAPTEAQKAPAPPAAAAADQARMKREDVAAREAASGARDAARAEAERAAAVMGAQARVPAAPAAPGAAAAKPAPAPRRDEVARQSAALAKFTPYSPEQWLQGIADLRRQRRHEEADKALAEFRQRYPGYRISEAMLEKVERK